VSTCWATTRQPTAVSSQQSAVSTSIMSAPSCFVMARGWPHAQAQPSADCHTPWGYPHGADILTAARTSNVSTECDGLWRYRRCLHTSTAAGSTARQFWYVVKPFHS
jgi:hypothetical protein